MQQVARYIGVPGAGKTETALRLLDQIRSRGYSLEQIGFCSFTRAARREAAQRASNAYGVPLETLERDGWFRTLHSCCARILGLPRGSIVNGDRDWLRDVLQERSLEIGGDFDADDILCAFAQGTSWAAHALRLWDIARSRLVPFSVIWELICSQSADGGVQAHGIDGLIYWIERYEKAKLRDGRMDFTDLLLRVAGIEMTVQGPQEYQPEGRIPSVPIWFFDEAQDTSPLLDRVARRLCADSIWVYQMGDPEQAIYSWAGADGSLFLQWPAKHGERLNKTWRCARNIMDVGIDLICDSSDNASIRKLSIEPRCEGGSVELARSAELLSYLHDATIPTLILTRANYQLSEIQNELTDHQIPYRSVRSGKRWPPVAALAVCQAFQDLEDGKTIDGDALRRIVQRVDARWLYRGTKTFYKDASSKDEVRNCRLQTLSCHGLLPGLVGQIASGEWLQHLKEEEEECWRARRRYGDLVDEPAIQVSTIHGSKGMQAQRVILLAAITSAVREALKTDEGQKEERRVWYVGATRARDQLVVLESKGYNYVPLLEALSNFS